MMMPSSIKTLFLVAGTIPLVLGVLSPVDAYTVYTNRGAWEAAVDAVPGIDPLVDPLSVNIPQSQSIIFPLSGIRSTNSFPPSVSSINTFFNRVSNQIYANAVSANQNLASSRVDWTFSRGPVFAFGVDLAFVSNQLTIAGNFDGTGNQTVNLNAALGGSGGGFLGIIGNARFGNVFFESTSGIQDQFLARNPSIDTLAQVPEPNTALSLIFVGSSLALGCLARRG